MRQTIDANGKKATFGTEGNAGIGIVISGVFVGTLQIEGTVDNGGSWVALDLTPVAGGAAVHQVTAPSSWRGSAQGLSGVRVRASAWTSGAASVGFALTSFVDVLASEFLDLPILAVTPGPPAAGFVRLFAMATPGVYAIDADGDVMTLGEV